MSLVPGTNEEKLDREGNGPSLSPTSAPGEAPQSLSTHEAQRWSISRTVPAFISTVTSESCLARWGRPGSCFCCGVSGKGPQGGGGEWQGRSRGDRAASFYFFIIIIINNNINITEVFHVQS